MFEIFRKNCCGLDVHKTWIYACTGITDTNGRTENKQARFSSFSKELRELAEWLAKYSCFDVLWNLHSSTSQYTKHQKGNKTDVKDAKWICQ